MDSREIRLIAFRVAGESFVLDIMAVRQIVPYTGSTPVPLAPSFIEGIIVLRSEVIPIIDLRSRLMPQAAVPKQEPLVLIVRTDEGVIGLKVDEVRKIMPVESDTILPPPPLIRGLQGDLFIGIIEYQQEIFLLLDLHTLLTPEEKRSLSDETVQRALDEAAKSTAEAAQ